MLFESKWPISIIANASVSCSKTAMHVDQRMTNVEVDKLRDLSNLSYQDERLLRFEVSNWSVNNESYRVLWKSSLTSQVCFWRYTEELKFYSIICMLGIVLVVLTARFKFWYSNNVRTWNLCWLDFMSKMVVHS